MGSTINAFWAATLIESFENTNFKMSESRQWGKASTISDSEVKIVEETPEKLNGNAVVDDDYLNVESWLISPTTGATERVNQGLATESLRGTV